MSVDDWDVGLGGSFFLDGQEQGGEPVEEPGDGEPLRSVQVLKTMPTAKFWSSDILTGNQTKLHGLTQNLSFGAVTF